MTQLSNQRFCVSLCLCQMVKIAIRDKAKKLIKIPKILLESSDQWNIFRINGQDPFRHTFQTILNGTIQQTFGISSNNTKKSLRKQCHGQSAVWLNEVIRSQSFRLYLKKRNCPFCKTSGAGL